MASSTGNAPTPNLATLVLIKRKMAAKNETGSNKKQLPAPPPAVTGAHSSEKINYRQIIPVENPPEKAVSTLPSNTTEQPKVTRKTKQLEVELLDKKMEEINRKHEEKTSETLDTWKGFDSLNYGFASVPETGHSTSTAPVTTKERTATPPLQKPTSPVKQQSAKKPSSPKRVDSPVEDQPKSQAPSKEEETRLSPDKEKPIERQSSPPHLPEQKPIDKTVLPIHSPHEEKPVERQLSPAPLPPPRRSKLKSPEPSKPLTPVTENIIPISTIISNPQIFQNNVQPFKRSSLQTSNGPTFKLFPDIKHYEIRRPRHALKSIQKSMDRYRFHVW